MHGKWHPLSCRLQVLPLKTHVLFFNESLLDKEKMTDAAALESLSERTNASHCTCLSTNTQKEFCATTCDTC